jgi:Tfp pilus assembly protein PilO
MAVAADFARLPTRQKVLVFVVIGLVIGAVYWQFVYKGLKADLEAAQTDNDSKKALNKQREKDIQDYEALRPKMASVGKLIEENQKALPTEAELPAFFETLNRKVLESGVEVIRSKQGKEEQIESFIKVPIEYEIQGTYVQIKKFFASLVTKPKKPGEKPDVLPNGEPAPEERERIVSIENLQIMNPVVRNREIKLTAKFVASTYRQEEAKGAAPAPAAKSAPAAAPAPAPAPAAPAKPATSTPAGAKASTEQSLDKGAQRMKEGK